MVSMTSCPRGWKSPQMRAAVRDGAAGKKILFPNTFPNISQCTCRIWTDIYCENDKRWFILVPLVIRVSVNCVLWQYNTLRLIAILFIQWSNITLISKCAFFIPGLSTIYPQKVSVQISWFWFDCSVKRKRTTVCLDLVFPEGNWYFLKTPLVLWLQTKKDCVGISQSVCIIFIHSATATVSIYISGNDS